MGNVEQAKMFAFAHFSYNKKDKKITLRVTRNDSSEALFNWDNGRDKISKYISSDTKILIDGSVPEEMRRECEKR